MIPDIIETLLIEDDPDDVLLLKASLAKVKAVKINLACANRLSEGLKHIAEQEVDVILLDLNLPDSRGLETLTTIIKEFPQIPIVVLSGLADEATTLEAVKLGAQDYLVKGEISGLMLVRVLRYAIERKRAETEARHLSSFPELNPTPIIEINMDGDIIYANPASTATLAQIGESDLRAFFPPDFADILKTADANHTQFRRIVEIRDRKFGETVYYTPEFQSMRLYARDITESMKIEEALRESEQRYRTLIENQEEGIALLDNKASFFFANQAADSTFGVQTGGLFRHNLQEFLTPEQFVVVATDMENHLLGEKTSYELEITRPDGQKRNLLVTATAQSAPDKTTNATFCIFRDITERKQAELALQRLNAELEQRVDERTAELSTANAALARASRLKDEFLASMSHELRTPLTAVLNLSEALQEQTYGPLTEKQLKSLRTIEESGRHLLGLINDILDLSQVEAGYLNLNIDECSVVDICQSSLQLVKGWHRKSIRISLL